MNPVIFDTGPLVAWFCPRDEHHTWARQAFAQIPAGGFICEAVLAEVCHLVAKEGVARGKVIEFVERARLTVVSLGGELPVVRALLECYADAPMDFADACVVRLSELMADHADRIAEIDVNPVLLGSRGGIAVDALLVVNG